MCYMRYRLQLAVLVDGSQVSKNAYDQAVSLCRAGDVLRVIHVRDASQGVKRFEDRSNTCAAPARPARTDRTVQIEPIEPIEPIDHDALVSLLNDITAAKAPGQPS